MNSWRGAGGSGKSAERIRLKPWTDPRLLLGILLVLAATVIGARAFAAADDSVEYWAVGADVRAGDPVQRTDMTPITAQLDSDSAGRYLPVNDELPANLADLRWASNASAGRLISHDDLLTADQAENRQLPVMVAESSVPADLERGDLVQVWVGSGPGDDGAVPAQLVLDEVRVARTGAGEGALEGSGTRSVLLDVAPEALKGEVVSAVAAGYVTLVRVR